MQIEIQARLWGTRDGGANGMAIATGFLAETLAGLGHDVQRVRAPTFGADLTLSVVSPIWRQTAAAAEKAGALGRTVYWHHAMGIPQGHGAILSAAPGVPVAAPEQGWARQVALPPSSWAADEGGECVGDEIVVSGAGPAKGGPIALQAARFLPGTRWLVLRGRSSLQDRAAWKEIPDSEVTEGIIAPFTVLERARLVLSPTRFETYGLLLVEAAVRGIPVVCTDLPATRASLGASAVYVPINAPPAEWAQAVRDALADPPPRLRLRPYRDVVSEAFSGIMGAT